MEISVNNVSNLSQNILKREDFPTLRGDNPPAFLDSAASSLKPDSVIERMNQYYRHEHSNVHRGVYELSELATAAFEAARVTMSKFLGDVPTQEVIFTRGSTDGINLLATCLSQNHLMTGDEIVLPVSEHHSNLVPWQLAASRVGATIRYIPLNEDFTLDIEAAKKLITKKTKVVAFAHASNVLGSILPVKKLVDLAKSVGAISIIDGAQGAPHLELNMKQLGCDAYTLSGHKMLGPTGSGVLWAKSELLDVLPPYQSGGSMIESVTLQGSTWSELPHKFEAGTPSIAEAIGLATAAEDLMRYRESGRKDPTVALANKVIEGLSQFSNVKIFKPAGEWTGVVSFEHTKVHPHDMAAIQDSNGVCVRAGHHCCQPLMKWLDVNALVRVSPYLYNNEDDIERFLKAVDSADQMFHDV